MHLAPLLAGIFAIVAGLVVVIFREPIFHRMAMSSMRNQGELGVETWGRRTPQSLIPVALTFVAFGLFLVSRSF